jgi:dehydrogenase/reductase SDR family protein 7B
VNATAQDAAARGDGVVWIVGASSGFGAALARAWAAEGARVVLSARRDGLLKQVAADCGSAAVVLPLDVTQPATFPTAVEHVRAACGRIDVLVYNSGLGQRATALSTRPEDERTIFETNFFGATGLVRAALPAMLAQGGGGRIVIVSSVLGRIAIPFRSAYAASKHALHGWFEALREEVRTDGIGVTLVLAGYLRTDFSRHALGPGGRPHALAEASQSRGLPPARAAAAVLRAVSRGRDECVIGGWETWALRLRRWVPRLFALLLRRATRRGMFLPNAAPAPRSHPSPESISADAPR